MASLRILLPHWIQVTLARIIICPLGKHNNKTILQINEKDIETCTSQIRGHLVNQGQVLLNHGQRINKIEF